MAGRRGCAFPKPAAIAAASCILAEPPLILPHLPLAVAALDKQQLGALLEGPREKDTFVALYAPWCRFCKVRFPAGYAQSQNHCSSWLGGGHALWCRFDEAGCVCLQRHHASHGCQRAGCVRYLRHTHQCSSGAAMQPPCLKLLPLTLPLRPSLYLSHFRSINLQGLEEDYAELAEQMAGSNVTVAKFQVRCAALCDAVHAGLSCEQQASWLAHMRPTGMRRCFAMKPSVLCQASTRWNASQRQIEHYISINTNNISSQADVERDFAADKFGLKTFPTLVLLPKSGKSGAQLFFLFTLHTVPSAVSLSPDQLARLCLLPKSGKSGEQGRLLDYHLLN